jgi:hypothetical protein
VQFAYNWGPNLTFWEKVQNLLDLPQVLFRLWRARKQELASSEKSKDSQ